MKQVSVHGSLTIEPTLGHHMLPIIAIAFAVISTALVSDGCVFVGWGTTRNIGVDVPDFAIALDIRLGKSIP